MEEFIRSSVSKEEHEIIFAASIRIAAIRKDRYKKRSSTADKPTDEPKILKDMTQGIIAERAIRNYFIESGQVCTNPDLTVWGEGHRYFAHDLVTNKKQMCHVKSFLECSNFRKSGVFERDCRTVQYNDGGFFILCEIHVRHWEQLLKPYGTIRVDLHCFMPMKVVHEKKLWAPLENGNRSKICIPLDQIQLLSPEERWSILQAEVYGL